jgi:hypothetical protein
VPTQSCAAFRLDLETATAPRFVLADEIHSRIGLACAEKCNGVQMSGVVVVFFHDEKPLSIEDRGPVEIGVETRPDQGGKAL